MVKAKIIDGYLPTLKVLFIWKMVTMQILLLIINAMLATESPAGFSVFELIIMS